VRARFLKKMASQISLCSSHKVVVCLLKTWHTFMRHLWCFLSFWSLIAPTQFTAFYGKQQVGYCLSTQIIFCVLQKNSHILFGMAWKCKWWQNFHCGWSIPFINSPNNTFQQGKKMAQQSKHQNVICQRAYNHHSHPLICETSPYSLTARFFFFCVCLLCLNFPNLFCILIKKHHCTIIL